MAIEMVGQQREQKETFKALGRGYILALFLIYALLAVPFRSYVQPVIIMGVIPFGFVGAIWGHAVMGYGLSLMSMFGLVALSGVVVNDSLVLIDATNKARREDPEMSAFEAVLLGGKERFRPILLTSLTTFFGLMPMLTETSMQARFLIPMAISLGFGVLAATVVVLLLVPALYLVIEDLLDLVQAAKSRLSGL
jgi:multidrug efflux pump subunit AcrB